MAHAPPNDITACGGDLLIRITSRSFGVRTAMASSEFSEMVYAHKWFLRRSRDRLYVVAHRTGSSHLLLHREITRCPPGLMVDHINGDTLDNRMGNLRVVNNSQNMRNVGRPRSNTSGYKGVSWNVRGRGWWAYAEADERRIHLGFHGDVHEAGRIAHEWRARHYPESPEARTPFVINPNAGHRET